MTIADYFILTYLAGISLLLVGVYFLTTKRS